MTYAQGTDVNTPLCIGEYCVYCFHSVDINSGRYINRTPAIRGDGENYLHLDGYICDECLEND